MELQCKVQNYEWGKLGSTSKVAQLAINSCKALLVKDNIPYAELWMGTHVNGPSHVTDTDEPLSTWLNRNLDSLGVEVRKAFGDELPFLFKVLSVKKALSIQAHPNKTHAEKLHKEHPDLYKDPNHKPELAIALTDFEALCGFRDIDKIKTFITLIPELQDILGQGIFECFLQSKSDDAKSSLKNAFRQLMECDAAKINENLSHAIDRLSKESDENKAKVLFPLLKKLSDQFPGDRGCFCIYFLNYLILKPGEAIFLGPNIPHAYIYGDCIECMACSDNVVRAGLTPKYIDVPTLIDMLIYDSQSSMTLLFDPIVEDQFTKIWRPPVQDFAVAEIRIPAINTSEYNTIMRPSVSILLVISGKALVKDSLEKEVVKGTVLYLKASRQLTIIQSADSGEDLVIYQAMCNF